MLFYFYTEFKIMSTQKDVKRLTSQNAILRKAAADRLGLGYWGYTPKEERKITHEEIVFLFARSFQMLGFESILLIQTSFPDCIAVKDGLEKSIEFESYLSDFDHIKKTDDLSKCDYVICWEDDLDKNSYTRKSIREAGIEVIELREVWEKTKVRRLSRPFVYNKKDFEKMRVKPLKVLSAFIKSEKNFLTKQEIAKFSKIENRALGGSMTGFFQVKNRDWIIKHSPGGYKFNEKYRDVVRKVLSEADII